MRKRCPSLFLLLLSASLLYGQSNPALRIEPHAGALFTGTDIASVFGLTVSAALNTEISAGICYKTYSLSEEIDTPGDPLILSQHAHLLQAVFTHQGMSFWRFIRLSPMIAAGIIYFSTPSRIISLGGFGQKELPSRSSLHYALTPAGQLHIRLSGGFSIMLSSGVLIYKDAQQLSTEYFADGGISYAIR